MASTDGSSTQQQEVELPVGWRKYYSHTHKNYYYFNATSGVSSWEFPSSISKTEAASTPSISKAAVINGSEKLEEGEESKSKECFKPSSQVIQPARTIKIITKVAIVVPFRDLHKEQNRKKHLDKFIPAMINFLKQSSVQFQIFIIEQSDDNRKFNRGKLLNIGFDIAVKEHFNIVIFHDVDLIPTAPALLHTYTCPFSNDSSNNNQPVHIAKLWQGRYSENDNYFGGIVKFSAQQFRAVNGALVKCIIICVMNSP